MSSKPEEEIDSNSKDIERQSAKYRYADDSGFAYQRYYVNGSNQYYAQQPYNQDTNRTRERRGRRNHYVEEQLSDLQHVNDPRWVETFNSSAGSAYTQSYVAVPPPEVYANMSSSLPLVGNNNMGKRIIGDSQLSQQPVTYYSRSPNGRFYPAIPVNSYSSNMRYGDANNNSLKRQYEYDQQESGDTEEIYQSGLQKESRERRRKRRMRESISSQRGRRLSQGFPREGTDLLSPHKDVPTRDLYRHSNLSIGKDLQLKQIFTWSLSRELESLRKRNLKSGDGDGVKESKPSAQQLAYDIFKNFVKDIKSSKTKIDWSGSGGGSASNSKKNMTTEEDSLSEYSRLDSKAKKVYIPNLKNKQNRDNLQQLNERIIKLEKEKLDWMKSLEIEVPHLETYIPQESEFISDIDKSKLLSKKLPDLNLDNDLKMRIDRFQETCHLIDSNVKLLGDAQKAELKELNKFDSLSTIANTGEKITNNHPSIADILIKLSENSKN